MLQPSIFFSCTQALGGMTSALPAAARAAEGPSVGLKFRIVGCNTALPGHFCRFYRYGQGPQPRFWGRSDQSRSRQMWGDSAAPRFSTHNFSRGAAPAECSQACYLPPFTAVALWSQPNSSWSKLISTTRIIHSQYFREAMPATWLCVRGSSARNLTGTRAGRYARRAIGSKSQPPRIAADL